MGEKYSVVINPTKIRQCTGCLIQAWLPTPMLFLRGSKNNYTAGHKRFVVLVSLHTVHLSTSKRQENKEVAQRSFEVDFNQCPTPLSSNE